MISSAASPFNNNQYSSQLRQPRAIVMINDTPAIWENIEIATTTFFIADSYSMTLPLSGQNPILNLNYWASVTDITVKIYVGFPLNPFAYTIDDLELLSVGVVDMLDVDPLTARVMLSGRDLSARLIDTKTTLIYPNDTASNIAILLAKKHNLTPMVTATTGNVGRFFNNFETNAQNLLTKQITEWDLLTFLAQQSNFVTYVQAENLIFGPLPTDASSAYILNFTPPQSSGLTPTYGGTQLHFRRSLTLAADVAVKIIVPTNPQTGKSSIKTARYNRKGRAALTNVPAPSGRVTTYTFIMPGLTDQQAQQQANSLAQSISLNEIIISTTRPGDNLIKKGGLLKVAGTGSAYDQIYFLDQVTRTLNIETGYQMEIIAKNHDVSSNLVL
jgi:phage protein D